MIGQLTIVNKYKHKPIFEEHDVYIGRGSALGNPFTHMPIAGTKAQTQVASREEAIEKYREYIRHALIINDSLRNEIHDICDHLKQGTNVNLVCFCKPKSCHGDVLAEIIEEIMKKQYSEH